MAQTSRTKISRGQASFARTSRIACAAVMLLGGLAVVASVPLASAQEVSREQDIGTLRLGQRIKVDDGTCPPGQVKEVSGSKMTAAGVARSSKCIPRLGAKTSAPTK